MLPLAKFREPSLKDHFPGNILTETDRPVNLEQPFRKKIPSRVSLSLHTNLQDIPPRPSKVSYRKRQRDYLRADNLAIIKEQLADVKAHPQLMGRH